MEQTKIREQVIDDLKQYPELKKKVILLRYEQEHPAKISDSEVIDSMALSRPVSDGIRPAGFISDKTMRIATQFRDKKDRLNQETIMKTNYPVTPRQKRSRCRSNRGIIDSPTPLFTPFCRFRYRSRGQIRSHQYPRTSSTNDPFLKWFSYASRMMRIAMSTSSF